MATRVSPALVATVTGTVSVGRVGLASVLPAIMYGVVSARVSAAAATSASVFWNDEVKASAAPARSARATGTVTAIESAAAPMSATVIVLLTNSASAAPALSLQAVSGPSQVTLETPTSSTL